MKTLFLIRHAKSDWAFSERSDIDRTLNARGYNDAHEMGKHLLSKKLIPEKIISSPAIRAISTALIIARNTGYNAADISFDESLYESTEEQYLNAIYGADDRFNSLAIVGHNPVISEIARFFGIGEEMKTCSVCVFKMDIESWSKALPVKVLEKFMFNPKEIE